MEIEQKMNIIMIKMQFEQKMDAVSVGEMKIEQKMDRIIKQKMEYLNIIHI